MAGSTGNLLEDWYRRTRFAQFAHYEAAKVYDRMNYWLGIPVVILTTCVGTSVFANIGKSVDPMVEISIGLVSVIAAALASLQTFFQFAQKAEKHRAAASKYGALRREIEETLSTEENPIKDTITAIRQKIDRLSDEAPNIPSKIWDKRQDVLKDDQVRSVGLLDKQ
jgi:hypothetical protein